MRSKGSKGVAAPPERRLGGPYRTGKIAPPTEAASMCRTSNNLLTFDRWPGGWPGARGGFPGGGFVWLPAKSGAVQGREKAEGGRNRDRTCDLLLVRQAL